MGVSGRERVTAGVWGVCVGGGEVRRACQGEQVTAGVGGGYPQNLAVQAWGGTTPGIWPC